MHGVPVAARYNYDLWLLPGQYPGLFSCLPGLVNGRGRTQIQLAITIAPKTVYQIAKTQVGALKYKMVSSK